MSSYRQLLFHLVFRTKNSLPSLTEENTHRLYSYIAAILRNKKCHLYSINGFQNHIHVLTDIHPSLAPADLIREVKSVTSKWIKENTVFSHFDGWSEGYGLFTCSYPDLSHIIEYIENQREHHRKKSFEDEYRSLILKAGLKIDESYFP